MNFFSRVDVAEDGGMSFHAGNSQPGAYVELRAEMNVLAVLNTCQHPLDPNPKYAAASRSNCRFGACRAAGPGRSLPSLAAGERARIHADGDGIFSEGT